jgi:hypothetical protein
MINNIHFALPNGATLSIAEVFGEKEIAVIGTDREFVSAFEWCSPHNDDDTIVRLSGDIDDLMEIIARASAWATKDVTRRYAEALDQAL